MDRFACRDQLWADMEQEGLVLKVEKHAQRVPISQRGGEVIEPLVRLDVCGRMFVVVYVWEGLVFGGVRGCDRTINHITQQPNRKRQVSSQWFVKMDGMASQALGAVRSGELKIMPDMFEKVWCVLLI